MSFSLGPHILYSRNANELAHFLSELLDMDISVQSEGSILVKSDLVSLQVVQAPAQALLARNTERDTILGFRVDSLQALEDLVLKVQFLGYRHGESNASEAQKKVKLHQQDREYFFFLKDLDGRRWKFSFISLT